MSPEGPLRDGQPADFELIETLRYEPSGFLRIDRHLARLYGSAAELGFGCDPDRIGKALASAITSPAAAPQRIRISLRPNGDVSVSSQPYIAVPAGKIWKLQLARVRLNSADPLLRHKTSRRHAYIQARSEYLIQQADEVLLANERSEICEGTITSLFANFGDGILVTPRLDCGLLPGILRGELLDAGKAREEVLTLDQLRAAKALFVGNSLRGLIPAVL